MIPFPPTPTPLPPATPHFMLDTSYGVWGGTSAAITTWQWAGDLGLLLQAIIVVAFVILGIVIFANFLREFTRRDSQE